MKPLRSSYYVTFAALMIVVSLLLASCNRGTAQPTAATEALETTEPTAEATATPAAPPERILLVDPLGVATPELTAYLTSFAEENSLLLETMNSNELSPQTAETRVVIVLAEAAGMSELASASPATQFIVTGNIEPVGLANLSVITTRAEDLAFMGGYLTQLIAWDWRSAGLVATDTEMAAEKADAFLNGARYLCGRCTPFYAPIVSFPLLAQESAQADALAWGVPIFTLREHYVNAFYIDPDAASSDTLDSVMAIEEAIFNDVEMIGLNGTPNAERFTALLGYDTLPAIQQLLPQALAGSGGQMIGAQVEILTNNDPAVITPARIDIFNSVAAELASGFISPLSIP